MKNAPLLLISFAFLVLTLSTSHQGFAQISNYKAYAIFIYNFTKYTNYPEENSSGDFVITVLGKSKITEELNLMATQKNINGRKIIVNEVQEVSSVKDAHLVFVSSGKSGALDELKAHIRQSPTMIVTERDGLVKKGAHLSFVALENQSLRFEANHEALEFNRLNMSKSILALAYKE